MLTTLYLGSLFVAGTALVMFGAYFLMRWATGGDPVAQTSELASSVVFRVSALHGLILALVFAQEMIEYQQIRYDGAIEANAVADAYYDSARYGPDAGQDVQKALSEYVRIVVDEEWAGLGVTGRLAPAAWEQWDIAYNRVLDLDPVTKRQESLRDHMLDSLHKISETRVKRENHGTDKLHEMFWIAALSGVVLVALAYFPYPPRWHNLVLIGMFGMFTGVVVFFIYAFSNPYRPPGALTPAPFERLQRELAQ